MRIIFCFLCLLCSVFSNARNVRSTQYLCSNGWLIKAGDTLVFRECRLDSIPNLYTKTPWSKGKQKPNQLPKAYGNRKMIITEIERDCHDEMCFVAVHVKSDTLDEAVCYIEQIIDRANYQNNESGLIIPTFKKYRNNPVEILSVTSGRNSIGSPIITVRFRNTSNEMITGIKFSVSCYNSVKEEVSYEVNKRSPEILFSGKAQPLSVQSFQETLPLYEEAVTFGVLVRKVSFLYARKAWEWDEHVLESDVPETN